MSLKNPFNLEYQYQLYLTRMGLKEDSLHPIQKLQLKQTFMGACGQMLILLRDEVSKLPNDQAADILENFIHQIEKFFINQIQN
jgi:hypothetical protein